MDIPQGDSDRMVSFLRTLTGEWNGKTVGGTSVQNYSGLIISEKQKEGSCIAGPFSLLKTCLLQLENIPTQKQGKFLDIIDNDSYY